MQALQLIDEIIHEKQKLDIPVFDSAKQMVGHLIPVTLSSARDQKTVELLTRWRNLAKHYFFTQFEATEPRTQKWLEDTMLKDSSRLLFLIHSLEKPIGCYGFKNLTGRSAELDQLIRGEMGGHPKLIYYAEAALIRWLFETFQLEQIEALVLSDNRLVLEMHKTLGFKFAEKLLLESGLYAQKVELLKKDFNFSR